MTGACGQKKQLSQAQMPEGLLPGAFSGAVITLSYNEQYLMLNVNGSAFYLIVINEPMDNMISGERYTMNLFIAIVYCFYLHSSNYWVMYVWIADLRHIFWQCHT